MACRFDPVDLDALERLWAEGTRLSWPILQQRDWSKAIDAAYPALYRELRTARRVVQYVNDHYPTYEDDGLHPLLTAYDAAVRGEEVSHEAQP